MRVATIACPTKWAFRLLFSLRKMSAGLRDVWFLIGSCLVFTMVPTTWVMTFVLFTSHGSSGGNGLGFTLLFGMACLLRPARMARMAWLRHAMSVWMIPIKGMLAAVHSVYFMFRLLLNIRAFLLYDFLARRG